jgi:histidine ammonia-lyase
MTGTATEEAPLDLADASGQPGRLSVQDVVSVARHRRRVLPLNLPPAAPRPLERAMQTSRDWVDGVTPAAGEPRAVYGINTGFGALAGRRTFGSVYHARVLSRNLLVSHAAGAGSPLAEDVLRATALIRSRQLAHGVSGVRVAVVNRLVALLNADVYPFVPSRGSLGASGDLAPLAHLALVISKPPVPEDGDVPVVLDDYPGEAWVETTAAESAGPRMVQLDPATGRERILVRAPADAVMAAAGGQITLEAKEGLALNNGATVSAALLALAVADAGSLLDHVEVAAALTLEALRGFRDAFLPEVHAARPHPGAMLAASRVLAYVEGSTLLDPASQTIDPGRTPPQDPYSVRCMPQVVGAARDVVAYANGVCEIEINSAVDNPLVFTDLPRPYKTVSCGNFHGAPLGYALDFLKVALTDVASQSERRAFKLTDYWFRDPMHAEISLPSFLVESGPELEGLNSGMMIPQYTAASLVSAAKTLAHPDSVDSIPSSANQEDHVSMSLNAGLHALQIMEYAVAVVAIELLCAAQALEFRTGQGALGRGTAAAYAAIRDVVAPLVTDRSLHRDIAGLANVIRSGSVVRAARSAAGLSQ